MLHAGPVAADSARWPPGGGAGWPVTGTHATSRTFCVAGGVSSGARSACRTPGVLYRGPALRGAGGAVRSRTGVQALS